jgi:endonuclease/exonuclease/phosphatase family metal-dependent hydrolase
MRVLTWNIHGARDAPLERIADDIAAVDADVVCLNEIRRRHGRRLGRALGMRHYVSSSFVGPYGTAIYTNEPIVWWRRLRFTGVRRIDRRDATVVKLRDGPMLAAVHLPVPRGERARNGAELLAAVPDDAIIAGDLNAMPHDDVPRAFAARFEDACVDGALPTFPADVPRARIDYVWVPRGSRVGGCGVIRTSSSDHLPVVVDLDP